MKISGVKATCYSVPLSLPYCKEPFEDGAVCVRVETDEGITGIGFTGDRLNRFALREYILYISSRMLKFRFSSIAAALLAVLATIFAQC